MKDSSIYASKKKAKGLETILSFCLHNEEIFHVWGNIMSGKALNHHNSQQRIKLTEWVT